MSGETTTAPGGAAPKPDQAPDPLTSLFDCVIMLTQSDWATEPRSNRYHYATRFAARLPTYFVQPDGPHTAITQEATEIAGLTLVHCAWWDAEADATAAHEPRFEQVSGERDPNLRPTPAAALKAHFDAMGVRRPLLWVYNPNYVAFLDLWPAAFKAFHATEDYTLDAASGRYFDDAYQALAYRAVGECDLLVAVSEAVRSNYLTRSGYAGVSLTLPNGCDFAFWRETGASNYRPPPPARSKGVLGFLASARLRQTVLYQGGVNGRVDFALIQDLARRMPDFDFVFCGPIATGAAMQGWQACLDQPNVRATGMLSLEAVAALARQAVVGIIPYRPTPLIAVSLPLKAYEYLACGLPVVTMPIPALETEPDLFRFASTAAEYDAAIRLLAPTRSDPASLDRRISAARLMDYGRRFSQLEAVIAEEASSRTVRETALDRSSWAVVAQWGATAVDCQEAWREAGADLMVEGRAATITTPRDAWNFAATVRIAVPAAEAAVGAGELCVTVADVEGDVTVSLFDEGDGGIRSETALANVAGAASYRLTMQPLRPCLLLFRNGARGSQARVRFLSATLSV